MTDRQIKNRVEKIRELQEAADALTAQVDALKAEIKDALGDTEEKRVGNWKILWKWRQGTRFDKTAFGKQYPDILKEFTVAKAPERFFRIDEVKTT